MDTETETEEIKDHNLTVIIICTNGTVVRQLMLTASDMGLINGQYAFITVPLYDNKFLFGDSSWKRGDEFDAKAKIAYEALMTFQLYEPDTEEYYTFQRNVKERIKEDFNLTLDETIKYAENYNSFFKSAFHDAIILYALAINETIAEGGDIYDGYAITRRMWNRTFKGVYGDVTITPNGDREGDFSMLDMTDTEAGTFQVVYNYKGATRTLEKVGDIRWPAGVEEPPLSVPVCGFYNENPACHSEGDSGQAKLSPSCRLTIANGVKLRETSDDGVNGRKQLFAEVAQYQGRIVALKRFSNTKVELNRTILVELKHMRDIEHSNIVRFVGACVDAPNVAVFWEYCPKGSLQDILENEALKLDATFKNSLIYDLIKGLSYLHYSTLNYHGRLRSSNCVIDSRFVLKLTDFGLHTFRKAANEQRNQKLSGQLWIAPEYLRTYDLPLSKEGDIYSVGIIIQEILTRSEPFDNERTNGVEVTTIVDKLKAGETPPFRPYVPEEAISSPQIKAIMEMCWAEKQNERPTVRALMSEIKRLMKETSGKNIVDNLLSRMEQYATNLETLVEERTAAFLEEKKRAETLLYEVLPKSVADKLTRGETVEPEAFHCVTIFFSDIIEFTSLSAESTPLQVVTFLNDLYICFDGIIGNFDVYKVETIGDAYMVVSGLPVPNGDNHAKEIAAMSLSLLKAAASFKIQHRPDRKLQLRAGVHSGPCVAGIVGLKMPRFCLFGDTVNTASRMESNGKAMKIHISSQTKDILTKFEAFEMDLRGNVELKGKGLQTTYWLMGYN
ncbi:atrial natriuretic peptide receptor 1-like [Amphiura filiformis]|uniref:atrial natriuretic peptide receptor 1-like n=1 Tax=Amphiura filiformis TaxID=82378 RepID=UPI003B220953